MGLRFRAGGEGVGGFLDDAADALGRKAELDKGNAAVERLRVAGDQAALETELADALEDNPPPLAFRQSRDELKRNRA